MSLLVPSPSYVPQYPKLVEITQLHERLHWHEGEVKLQSDVDDWKTGRISEADKKLISTVLRLFTQSDVAVGGDYYDNLIPVIKNNEARNMLGSFAGREGVHQRAYALLNDTLGFGDDFYNEFLGYREMVEKLEFITKVENYNPVILMKSIARQVMGEGVGLFGSFAMLLNYSRSGLMRGMSDVVRWSIRDESVHVLGLIELWNVLSQTYGKYIDDPFKAEIYELARECVRVEEKFISLAFQSGAAQDLSEADMQAYVRSLTDYRMLQLGFKAQFNAKNPLEWLDWVTSNTSSENFFEVNTANYSKNSMTGDYGDFWR